MENDWDEYYDDLDELDDHDEFVSDFQYEPIEVPEF